MGESWGKKKREIVGSQGHLFTPFAVSASLFEHAVEQLLEEIRYTPYTTKGVPHPVIGHQQQSSLVGSPRKCL